MRVLSENETIEGMKQVRIDGQVFAELDDDGELHLYPNNVPTVELCEVAEGWPGT